MKHRNWSKRVLALLLAFCLTLGLAGCGDGETEISESETTTTASGGTAGTTEDSDEEMGYLAAYPTLDAEVDACDSVQTRGGSVYITAYYDTDTLLLCLDDQGDLTGTLRFPEEADRYINALTPADDGIVAAVVEHRTEAEEEPGEDDAWVTAGIEAEDETEWTYETEEESYETVYLLAKYSMDGELLYEQEFAPPEDADWFSMVDLCVDGDGNVYFDCDGTVYVLDADFNALFTLDCGDMVMDLITAPDGLVYVAYITYDSEDTFYAPVDVETGQLGAAVTLQTSQSFDGYCAGADGLLYAYSDDVLATVELSTGVCETVLSWLDWDVDGTELCGAAPLADGSVLAVGWSPVGSGTEADVTLLTQTPLSEIPEKTEITLGYAESLDSSVYSVIQAFNRSQDTYRIVTVDYTADLDSSDTTVALSQLEQDILSGNCPDILVMDGLDTEKYIDRGYLVDLYTLMSEDTYEKDDFCQSLLTVLERNGGLYTIGPKFNVKTLVGASSYVGTESGWSLADFIEAVEKLPEDGLILDGYTRDEFLYVMLSYGSDAFVDRETGQCSFDSQEFVDLLNACMLFPEDTTVYDEYAKANGTDEGYSSTLSHYDMIYDELRDGTMLLAVLSMHGTNTLYAGAASCLDDDLTVVGYPGVGGNGAVISTHTQYAISATSEYQDVAWEFLCYILEDFSTADSKSAYFPALQYLLDEQLASLTEQPGYTEDDGSFVADDGMLALTEAQAQTVRDIIEGATASRYDDDTIQEIATEEAAAFFAGQKDAETVAAIIQDRVQTYLDEQG